MSCRCLVWGAVGAAVLVAIPLCAQQGHPRTRRNNKKDESTAFNSTASAFSLDKGARASFGASPATVERTNIPLAGSSRPDPHGIEAPWRGLGGADTARGEEPGDRQDIILRIEFTGMRRIAPAALRARIASREGQLLDAARIANDVRALDRLGWFDSVSAEVHPIPVFLAGFPTGSDSQAEWSCPSPGEWPIVVGRNSHRSRGRQVRNPRWPAHQRRSRRVCRQPCLLRAYVAPPDEACRAGLRHRRNPDLAGARGENLYAAAVGGRHRAPRQLLPQSWLSRSAGGKPHRRGHCRSRQELVPLAAPSNCAPVSHRHSDRGRPVLPVGRGRGGESRGGRGARRALANSGWARGATSPGAPRLKTGRALLAAASGTRGREFDPVAHIAAGWLLAGSGRGLATRL